MRAYVDADVLIWHLRGEQKARNLLRKLRSQREYELWIGAMQRAEIVFFMKDGEEEHTETLLSLLKTAPVDQTIVDLAGRLYREWNPSHGLDIHDAMLAATVMRTGGKILTLNVKHFPMPDIVAERAW